ncbi:transcriptional regulator domain-containing protein, partial [Klebsiella pneumoniae]|uniref:transcriptional regulator domain-containing protein n=2 Tax=Pseudomonadota TaxID=1224 RepID=UPI003C78E005
LDTLAPSDLAWEWLRRNEQYEHDVAAFEHAPPESVGTRDLIRERWGLRFPDTAVPPGARRAGVLAA